MHTSNSPLLVAVPTLQAKIASGVNTFGFLIYRPLRNGFLINTNQNGEDVVLPARRLAVLRWWWCGDVVVWCGGLL